MRVLLILQARGMAMMAVRSHVLSTKVFTKLTCWPLLLLQARDMVMMAVRSHFRPEFINRIDEFIMFDPLEQEQIKSIVRLQVCLRNSAFAYSVGTGRVFS